MDHNVDLKWVNVFNTGPYGKMQKLANFNLIIETMMSLYPYLINTHQGKAIHQKLRLVDFQDGRRATLKFRPMLRDSKWVDAVAGELLVRLT